VPSGPSHLREPTHAKVLLFFFVGSDTDEAAAAPSPELLSCDFAAPNLSFVLPDPLEPPAAPSFDDAAASVEAAVVEDGSDEVVDDKEVLEVSRGRFRPSLGSAAGEQAGQ